MIPRLLGRVSARVGRATARLDRRRLLAAVGGSSLALALGVVFLPWLFPASTFRPVSRVVGTQAAVAAFGAAAALLAAAALRESATDSGEDAWRPDAWLPDRSPERAHYDEVRTVGVGVDRALDFDLNEVDDPVVVRRDARNRVREVAVAVVAATQDCEGAVAAERVSDGTWTDDPRAAAFLGGRSLAPLGVRIRDWVSGERFERWATHAVAEIDALAEREDGPNLDRHADGPRANAETDVREGPR